jgi:hypothetical protein
MTKPRFYGITEIARALGVTRGTVAQWRHRGSQGMPAPDTQLASGPVWLAETIEPWMRRMGVDTDIADDTPPVEQPSSPMTKPPVPDLQQGKPDPPDVTPRFKQPRPKKGGGR